MEQTEIDWTACKVIEDHFGCSTNVANAIGERLSDEELSEIVETDSPADVDRIVATATERIKLEQSAKLKEWDNGRRNDDGSSSLGGTGSSGGEPRTPF